MRYSFGFQALTKQIVNKLLRRIGFVDSFTIELKVSVDELVNELNKRVDVNDYSLLNIFKTDKRDYFGVVTKRDFEMRRWKKILSFADMARAKGTIKEENERLIIDVEVRINNANISTIGFCLTVIIMSLIALASLISSFFVGINGILGVLGVGVFTLIFVGIPYFIQRSVISTLLYDVESDLKKIEKKILAKIS